MKILNKSLDPRDHMGVSNDTIYEWRQHLKQRLLEQRHYQSDLSGISLVRAGCHMHEGILTRANVPKSIKWHYYIYHPVNCFLLTPAEHAPNPPSRERCIEIASARYGKDIVREWYYGLPFKAFPFEIY